MYRSIARRMALAVAALAATSAAVPAAANATIVELKSDGTLTVTAERGETNNVNVAIQGTAVRVRDFGARILARAQSPQSAQCFHRVGVSPAEAICQGFPINIKQIDVQLGDRNDVFSSETGIPTIADGGDGNDMFFGGTSPLRSRVDFRGAYGHDTVTYSAAGSAVKVTKDDQAADGRIARSDADNVRRDIEAVVGSSFADDLSNSRTPLIREFPDKPISTGYGEVLNGGPGDDSLRGGGHSREVFDMGAFADGADDIQPGTGEVTVDYGKRTRSVKVTVASGGADDGEQGEGDQILFGVDRAYGGSAAAGDLLRGPIGSTAAIDLRGGPGPDTLVGTEGADTIEGGAGVDNIVANGGNDAILARDGEAERIRCGAGDDTADRDTRETDVGECERGKVGRLRLKPKAVVARRGVAKLELAWTHPRAWRKLRRIALVLEDRGVPVGRIAIDAKRRRIVDDRALARLVQRKRTRLVHKGKTVAARLAVKLDPALAGRRLQAYVEATETGGRRQVARAGTVRVPR